MTLKKEFEDFRDEMLWVNTHTSGLTLPADPRSLIVTACLDVTLEHQAAIALLFDSSLYGSMLALLESRPRRWSEVFGFRNVPPMKT
jgi:hypothetical protein